MNIIEELESVTAYVQNANARKRLGRVVNTLKAEAEAAKMARTAPKPNKRVSDAAHDAAARAGAEARRRGEGKDGAFRAGTLQERNAWLAGWNDEDIRMGGK